MEIEMDRQALISAYQEMDAAAFELEAYMDTARLNLSKGRQWHEEYVEIEARFQRLRAALEESKILLNRHKDNIKILKSQSEHPEVQPKVLQNE